MAVFVRLFLLSMAGLCLQVADRFSEFSSTTGAIQPRGFFILLRIL